MRSEGHFKKALEIFQKTLSSDKGSFFAMNGIGAVLAHKDKRHEAKVIFKSLEENLGERGTEILREVRAERMHVDGGGLQGSRQDINDHPELQT